MFPLPPDAEILALIVRSSVARLPCAARTMSPPTVFVTGELTVSGLLVRITILPDVASDNPVTPPTDPMIRLPVFSIKIPPEVLLAAMVIPTVEVVMGEDGVPMPVLAVSLSVEAVIEPDT